MAHASELETMSESVLEALRTSSPATCDGVAPELHWLPPFVPKLTWDALGDLVREREKTNPGTDEVPGDRWISLRLDGTGFSKMVNACCPQKAKCVTFTSTYCPLPHISKESSSST